MSLTQVTELLPHWDTKDKCTPVTRIRLTRTPATRTSATRTPTTRTKSPLRVIRQDTQYRRPVTKVFRVTPDTAATDSRRKERYRADRNRATIKRKVMVSKNVVKMLYTL